MRRAALVAVIVLLAATVPASGASMPGAGAAVYQMADAAWIVPESKHRGTFYFAGAMRMAPTIPAGVSTFGFVGKGRCFSSGDRNHGFTVCTGSGRGHVIDHMAFEMHPLLESAHLTLDASGFTHEVEWVGQGDIPGASGGASAGGYGVSAGAEIARWATASGTVFGLELRPGRDVFSFLMQGAMAGASLNTPGYTFHDDGTVTLRRVFRR